jgi:hypothetical protein
VLAKAMRKSDPLAFDIRTIPWGDTREMRTVAEFPCSRCDAATRLRISSDKPLNVEKLANTAKNAGWQTDGRRRSWNLCPTCARARNRNDTDSELKDVVPMTATSPPQKAATLINGAPQKTTVQASATTEQRMKIRALLDKHFDDASGCYLDGQSDQRIAEEVGVPRVVVEGIREAAYGPIREDPVVSELRAEIAALAKRIKSVEALIDDIKQAHQKLQTRADELGKKAA